MQANPASDQHPIYPATCYFKIIGVHEATLHARIQKALASIDLHPEVTAGNASAGGRYITYNVEVVVESHDHMNEIDGVLRAVDGVKYIL